MVSAERFEYRGRLGELRCRSTAWLVARREVLVREQRQWAAIALGATVALTLVLEIMWGLPSGYIRDLVQAAYASGAVQGGSAKLVES